MNAKVSINVTPGSETLWSVHSGQRRCTSRFASSTRSWNRRSSRFGAGSISSRSRLRGSCRRGRPGCGGRSCRAAGTRCRSAACCRRPRPVITRTFLTSTRGSHRRMDVRTSSESPAMESCPSLGTPSRVRGSRTRAHRSLARIGREDQTYRLFELLLATHERDAATAVRPQWKRPTGADVVVVHARSVS